MVSGAGERIIDIGDLLSERILNINYNRQLNQVQDL